MAGNSAKKQERIYQRNEEKDRIEIAKQSKADYMMHFPGGAAGYGNYGINSYAAQARTKIREIQIKQEDSGNDSVSVTNDNYQQRENAGKSQDSRRSDGRVDS